MSDPKLIVPLDFPSQAAALQMAARLDPARCRVKVGQELFTASGPPVLEALARVGFDVFLDLKFHDIPNTVAGACRAAAELGVWMVNVHGAGGRAMLEAARNALEAAPSRPLLIAVTVLTSMGRSDLNQVGIDSTPDTQALRLAKLAVESGLDGVVCSGLELEGFAAAFDPDFLRVTPGIRPQGSAAGDQKRIMTPGEAVRLGAHYLVIGRPITGAADPATALRAIEAEIADAYQGSSGVFISPRHSV